MKKSRMDNKKGGIAIGQILILVVGLFAFAYLIGGVEASAGSGSSTAPSQGKIKTGIMAVGGWVKSFLRWSTVGTTTGTGSNKETTGFLYAEGTSQILRYTVFAVGVTGALKALAVYKVTGDKTKAVQAGTRVGAGAGAGYLTGLLVASLWSTGPAGWITAGGIAAGAWASKYLKKETDRTIMFECKPWKPQAKGENCNLCNEGDFPCTEYQCRSLGTGCDLINKDTDEERCIWKNKDDLTAPGINANDSSLDEGYRYVELPDGSGVEIKYGDEECLPAFQPFDIQVDLDKEGYCKMSFDRTDNFSEMEMDFGGNQYKKEHTQRLTFPGADYIRSEAERLGIEIENAGEYSIYVRCSSAANDVSNRNEYVFKFCTDKGPDETPPTIRGFNWVDGDYVGYFGEDEEREVNIEVYTNEPAACKWSREDKEYDDMENELTCSNQPNVVQDYTCSGILDGLLNSQENEFFFRCKDLSEGENKNKDSKSLTLVGTQPLVINSVGPENETIKDSTSPVMVTLEAETSAGVNRGEADCYWKESSGGAYIIFSSTGTHTHSTNLWVEPGNYSYSIQCRDSANNADTQSLSFTVETDTAAPNVVRAYRDGSKLKVVTDEESECVYDTVDCNYEFEQGLGMTASSDSETHSIDWDANKNFYIKCKDDFGNQPAPQQCNIIARPFEL